MSYLPPQIDHVGDVGGPRTAHVEAVRVGGPINRGRPRPTSGDDSDHVGGSATAHVQGPRKRKLTGVALELAAGRMRHPDLAELHRQWLAEESGEADETPNPNRATMEPTWNESQMQRRRLVERGVAVVANLSTDKALIEWAKAEGLFTRVDRRSPWGNPFVLRREADRDDVCDRYAAHLSDRQELLGRVPLLRGCVLGCWCYPKRCHGDHLAALANGEKSSGPARQQELFR